MGTPWIEADAFDAARKESGWQAVFACQVCVRPFVEWEKLKWGFNASALLDEFLDRQKLFIESQYSIDAAGHVESPDQRTLALRLINIPGEGLQVGLLGRLRADTSEEAEKLARNYLREITSIAPYDYRLYPACSREDFRRIAGWDLLEEREGILSIAEIKRGDVALPWQPGFRVVPGIWQSGSRSLEQIWRSIAAMPRAALLNIALQPSLIYENEKQFLMEIRKNMQISENDQAIPGPLVANVPWGENYIARRLAAWKKFFYLQVHLVQEGELDESLLRSIGNAITRDSPELALPGYQLLKPATRQEARDWRSQLQQMQIINSSARLEQLADLDEVYAVFRLPHHAPPDGLPGVNYLCQELIPAPAPPRNTRAGGAEVEKK